MSSVGMMYITSLKRIDSGIPVILENTTMSDVYTSMNTSEDDQKQSSEHAVDIK
jgi:hypothetical protein